LTLNSVFARGYDADALAYIQSVETADGDTLESGVRVAIDNFVRGCKTDGIWSAIKSGAILAGARTLSGALQPLVGVAPTNFNFVSGDYNRKTGLVGNGTTKYLDSNRVSNAAGTQNNVHLATYVTTAPTAAAARFPIFIGVGDTNNGSMQYGRIQNNGQFYARSHNATADLTGTGSSTGLVATGRDNSSTYTFRENGSSTTFTRSSQSPVDSRFFVFNTNVNVAGGAEAGLTTYSNARLSFYSIGESLDLALLDARVTNLINAYAAEIP
jgi:hypothetical protein